MPTWSDLQQGGAGQLTRDRWAAAALAIANERELRRAAFWAEAEKDSGQVDPFLMGIREIAGAVRDLAEASQLTRGDDSISDRIESAASALHERVKALALLPES